MRLYSRVKRIQFDPNREKDEATFQNTYAVELFDLYRDKIKYLIEKAGGNGCLVLDLHGMGSGNPIMTQIGECRAQDTSEFITIIFLTVQPKKCCGCIWQLP